MANRPDRDSPFYIQITNVKEDFINAQGAPSSVDLPLVTLPPGTVLFRGLKLPNQKKGEDIRYFYRDFLGTPEGSDKVCLSPIHNVFFYPFPYIAFGASDVGKTFNMMQMVVLVHPVTLISCVSPSPFVRGISKRYTGTAPWQRCSNFNGPDYDCHPQSAKEQDAKSYDTCLSPEYQVKSGTRGWMAIANLDSLNPQRKRWELQATTSTMGNFLRSLNSQIPGEGKKAVTLAYTDENRHIGFPEIALYPYYTHKGKSLITRACPDEKAAMKLLENEASNNNLNYLPIAAFTKNSTVDMISGHFNYERLQVTDNSFDTVSAQQAILTSMHSFMEHLQTTGVDLPYYGFTKLVFDSRTGFFALNSIVPIDLLLTNERIAYRSLLLSLESQEAQISAMKYILLFRSFLPEQFMQMYPIEQGFKARRAMIFNRPPALASVFTDLHLNLPKQYLEPLARSGRIYRQETSRIKKPLPANTAKAAKAANELPFSPPAHEVTPPYAQITPPGHVGPWYGPNTPPTISIGGTRKLYKKDTSEHKSRQYASLFARVWKSHARV